MPPHIHRAHPQILCNVFKVGLELIHVKAEHKNVAYQKVDLVIRYPPAARVRILEQPITFITDHPRKMVLPSRINTHHRVHVLELYQMC